MGKIVNLEEIRRHKVLERVIAQQEKGLEKYGKLVDPDDRSTNEWLEHFQQELVDGHVYAEVLRQKLQEVADKAHEALLNLYQYDRWNDDSFLDLVHERLEEILYELGVEFEQI